MTTVFVHRVLPDGVAEQVGVREGDKVFSIGGERITSASREDVMALLKMQEEELVMVVCPKSDDVLQLSVSGQGGWVGHGWRAVFLICPALLYVWATLWLARGSAVAPCMYIHTLLS